jgi:hypothetical protein
MLFKERVPIYRENHMKPLRTKRALLIFKVAGNNTYRLALKG